MTAVRTEASAGSENAIDLARFPEFPLWNRIRLSRRWLPPDASSVLDAGCAWGYGTRFFIQPGLRVSGVDNSDEFIQIARRRYPTTDFRSEPLENLSHDDSSFDYIICADVLEHVSDPIKVLSQMHRVLRPGGHLFLSTPHKGAFGALDPYNYGRALRKNLPSLYSRLMRGKKWREGMPIGEEHRHYSEANLRALLKSSHFASDFTIEKRFKSGLLLYPLELNVGIVIERVLPAKIKKLAQLPFLMIAEADYWIPYGDLSFNIALLVRKNK